MNFRLPGWQNYRATWIQYADFQTEALYITKPIDPVEYSRRCPHLKALIFEFNKTGFKKNFDFEKYIEQWLSKIKLEYLGIYYGHNLVTLSPNLKFHPLKFLYVEHDHITNIDEIISYFPSLLELGITSRGEISLGTSFGQLNILKHLSLKAESITDISPIWTQNNIRQLSLEIENLVVLPKDIYKLTRLRQLNISIKNLIEIEAGQKFPLLEQLSISIPNTLKALPDSLFSTELNNIRIFGPNMDYEIDFPETINLPVLEKLNLSSFTIRHFPDLIVPKLSYAHIQLGNNKILSHLKQAYSLEQLRVSTSLKESTIDLSSRSLVKYTGPVTSSNIMDLSNWPELALAHLIGPENKSTGLVFNEKLTTLEIRDCKLTDTLDYLPSSLEHIIINRVSGLTKIALTENLLRLTRVNISNCPDFKQMELKGKSLLSLSSVSIVSCPEFNNLSPNVLLCPNLSSLSLSNNKQQSIADHLKNLPRLLKYLKTAKLSDEDRYALGFWLLGHSKTSEITDSLRESTFSLLKDSNIEIYKIIAQNITNLNHKKIAFEELTEKDFTGKTLAIAGNPFNTKTAIKNEGKTIGLKPITQLEKADFIVIGKKAEFDFVPSTEVILLTEKDLSNKAEKLQPSYLKSANTSQKVKNNLREILWSTDPNSENMALEMMKKGGMPDEVLGECIAISKSSKDKNVKSKYKRFLKGKVSAEIFDLVSKNVNFSKTNPFYKLQREFSEPILGKLAVALYKRTGNFWAEVLNLHRDDHEIRNEIIQNKLIPIVLNKPHYLTLRYSLTNKELHSILNLPELKGKIKRLIMSATEEQLPDIIGEHITLKELDIHNPKLTIFPTLIYELKRLSILKIRAPLLKEIDERISNLTQLKDAYIYADDIVRVHESINELPKLRRIYCSKGTEYFS